MSQTKIFHLQVMRQITRPDTVIYMIQFIISTNQDSKGLIFQVIKIIIILVPIIS